MLLSTNFTYSTFSKIFSFPKCNNMDFPLTQPNYTTENFKKFVILLNLFHSLNFIFWLFRSIHIRLLTNHSLASDGSDARSRMCSLTNSFIGIQRYSSIFYSLILLFIIASLFSYSHSLLAKLGFSISLNSRMYEHVYKCFATLRHELSFKCLV